MGKGRRTRAQRQHKEVPLPGGSFPFEVDARTREELGEQGLALLAANLWPKDCQSCGWGLGSERPTVQVQDMTAFTQMTLHHQRCQSARWLDGVMVQDKGAALVSYDVLTFTMPGQAVASDGTRSARDDSPVFLINPSLELLTLVNREAGWSNGSLERYHHAGMRPPGPEMIMDRPLPGASASLGIGELVVTLSPAETWSCAINVSFKEAVEDHQGVLLAVTSALVPSQMGTFGEFIELIKTSHIAMGWVQLVAR